jgi:hypothetical protein
MAPHTRKTTAAADVTAMAAPRLRNRIQVGVRFESATIPVISTTRATKAMIGARSTDTVRPATPSSTHPPDRNTTPSS